MSDHDFEKRVKQKMDELRFSPSDAVWKGLETELRRDRPNRRGWLWMAALLVATGISGYFFFTNNHTTSDRTLLSTTTNNQQDAKNKEAGRTANVDSSGNNPKVNEQSSSPEVSPQASGSGTHSASPHRSSENNPDVQSSQGSTVTATGKDSRIGSGKKIDRLSPPRQADKDPDMSYKPARKKPASGKLDPQLTLPNSNDPVKSYNQNNKEDNRPEIISTENDSSDKNNSVNKDSGKHSSGKNNTRGNQSAVKNNDETVRQSDSIAKATGNSSDQQEAADSGIDSTAKQPDSSVTKGLAKQDGKLQNKNQRNASAQKSSAAKKWTWGVAASAGISKLSDGKVGDAFKSSRMADAAPSSPLASSNNAFVFRPVTATRPIPQPSEIKPGVQISLGGFVKRQIGKRFAVSAGLQYSQYSNIINVGYRVDSSQLVNNGNQVANVGRYYRADQTNKFSNRYHFIELPVTVHMQLNKSLTTPVYWNVGAGVGQLVGSNALMYDGGTGVYYEDKTKYNKTQFSIHTGFSLGLFQRSALPVWIGPSIRYNVNRLYNHEIEKEKHLFSAGLDFRFFLNNSSRKG